MAGETSIAIVDKLDGTQKACEYTNAKYLSHNSNQIGNHCGTIDKSLFLLFEDVSYSVRAGIITRATKKLLRNICGDFRPGELTAIMGPSGAGKTTLIDILAGFTEKSVTGSIMINGKKRNVTEFRRISSYIMQNSNLQPLLTTQEAMMVAADLKVNLKSHEKIRRIDEILTAIGLTECRDTQIGKLSGGQRKRLTIALELINNPPIMFFDEPTSGLDSVTSKQCLGLLQKLAHEGRTIVCTIHQPSASLFYMIDHLYVISDGKCVYTGSTKKLVPYLSSLGLSCPIYYNPADYLMDICMGEYGNHVAKLTESIGNGKSNFWRSGKATVDLTREEYDKEEILAPDLVSISNRIDNLESPLRQSHSIDVKYRHTPIYATSFWMQLFILIRRNLIRLSRDKVLTFTRIIMHLIVALLVGTIYFRIGLDAADVFDNINLLFFSIMFLMFSAFSAICVSFPSELPILMREHFNRWYKLSSFYWANKLCDFPIQLTATCIYTIIVYILSEQIREWTRFGLWMLMCFIITLVAQTFGLVIGASMSVQNGVIFGPFAILPFLIFSGFFIHMSDAHPYLHWLFHISWLKYGYEGVMAAIYGYDRPKMGCKADYCQFSVPKNLLNELDMNHLNYSFCIMFLVILYIILDIAAYSILRLRLNKHINTT